ncbi:hypothetical protein [Glycomyces xiaoerkulensis]|uniref:hypothetical protein n=1 Tax=Glycomyces xiaoerkulensis TaxID=2038139 RepID=UPI000C269BAE|nr:hypothetical protein [Glycomyces xiaoerkulensis]
MIRHAAARASAAAALLGAAALAWAAPVGAHDDCHGVAVVVDFGEAGADAGMREAPVVGCAEDDPGSGIEALDQAGFAVTEVASFPGAVCRIEEFPETDCGPMPPADRSWSYWRAADGAWEFSNVGAGTADPDDGDVEGWVFGDGSAPPDLDPDEAAAPESTADPETSSTPSPTWIVAIVILAAVAGLAIWRLRERRTP